MSDIDLDAIRARSQEYLAAGQTVPANRPAALVHEVLTVACSSAADVPDLLDEIKQLRMDIEWHRVKQVQHLDEIKQLRAQLAGGSWPPAALPQRVPGKALDRERECGWMPHSPMTDPALEDRTEGEQP